MEKTLAFLEKNIGKKVKTNARLNELSTFKIGGQAEYFTQAKNSQELIKAIKTADKAEIPYRVIAGGSNLVFTDGQLKGLLIKIVGGEIKTKNKTITTSAGIPLAKLISLSINHGLKGLETLSGIPGTVGGAIVGNAGAYGHSISETLDSIEIFNGKSIYWLKKSDCRFGYRDSIFKHKPWIILSGKFLFKTGNAAQLKKTSKEIIKLRLKKYQPDLKCPGSFFKNILVKDVSKKSLNLIDKSKIIEGKLPAGWLLEQVGAKGLGVGKIVISSWHANLFINRGNGRGRDVKNLANILKRKVKNKFGITLEEEIRYIK